MSQAPCSLGSALTPPRGLTPGFGLYCCPAGLASGQLELGGQTGRHASSLGLGVGLTLTSWPPQPPR